MKGSQAAAATMLIQVPKELDAANLTYLQGGRVRGTKSVESLRMQRRKEGAQHIAANAAGDDVEGGSTMRTVAVTCCEGKSSKPQVQAVTEQGKSTQPQMLAASLSKSDQLSTTALGIQQNAAPSLH